MVHDIYVASFLESFKGLKLTSKSVMLATKNSYTFTVDRHLDKPLIKAVLEFLMDTPVESVQTRSQLKTQRTRGNTRKMAARSKLKTVQVTFKNKTRLKEWVSY